MKKLITSIILVLITAAAFAQAKPRLGILPFTGGTGRDGDSIANLFANSPDLKQEFSIVPRTSSIGTLMREQEFQRSGLTDSDTIADLGKQMNADYVVSGHITPLGNTNLLSISIVDVKTMRQVAGDYEEYDKIETIRSLLPPMARRISTLIRTQSAVPPAALAVLPLNIMDSDVKQGDAEILAQILATEIANSRKYAVFPRTKTIEAVMAEQQIQRSGLTDRESMIAIGKATNARYVLAGTITKLGSMNLFDVKILDVESGEQVKGVDRDYADLSDGIDLMGDLAYGLTGVAADEYTEARRQGRLAAAKQREKDLAMEQKQREKELAQEQRQREKEQKQREKELAQEQKQREKEQKQRERELAQEQKQREKELGKAQKEKNKEAEKANFIRDVKWFLRGDKEERFTSLGANLGLSAGYPGVYFFVDFNATIPLVWNLFVEGGIELGVVGVIYTDELNSDGSAVDGSQSHKNYNSYRPYGRLNIGFPADSLFFEGLWYIGVGISYINATDEYEYSAYQGLFTQTKTVTVTLEHSGMDLAFGGILTGKHHGFRFGLNLNHFSFDGFMFQLICGYSYRF
jgi:TolB-like protein/flagellar motor protein MotB